MKESEERLFFYHCVSKRLSNVPFLGLMEGDLVNSEARSFSANRVLVFGEDMRIKGDVTTTIKAFCRKGAGSEKGSMRLRGHPANLRSFLAHVIIKLPNHSHNLESVAVHQTRIHPIHFQNPTQVTLQNRKMCDLVGNQLTFAVSQQ